MKKILYISYDGMTDWLGQSQVLPYLGGLVGCGYEIHLISFEKPEAKKQSGKRIREFTQKLNIVWHPQRYTSRPQIISTLKDIYRMKRVAVRLHRKHGFDVVHARSYIPAMVAMHLKKKHHVKFVFDMRGLWVDERVEGNIWNIRNPLYKLIYRYFKNIEKKFLRFADATICQSNVAVQIVKEISQNDELNIYVIPCSADLEHFNYGKISEEKKSEIMKKLNLSDEDRVLSYLGSIGTWYMLEEMLDFFRMAQQKGAFTKFLFITKERKKWLKYMASKHGICPSDVIVVSSTREDVPLYVSVSDANVFFIKQSFSKKASSPVKFAEILGMGIPVITNAGVGDVEQLFHEANIGILLMSFAEESMHGAIDRLPELQNYSKESIRQLAFKYFDLKKGIDEYKKIYDQCVGSEKI